MNNKLKGALLALAAAALYAINIPISKEIIPSCEPMILAGLLYLGAGIGVGAMLGTQLVFGSEIHRDWLGKEDLKYTVAMVVLDIAAPICLMVGLAKTNAANVSLLNNFEIVSTAIIALVFFKEKISFKLWAAIILVLIATSILTFEGQGAFKFNIGSCYVLLACIFWGLENNCTRSLSDKNTQEIVMIKGIFSGLGSIVIGLIVGGVFPKVSIILAALILGFVAYGLSINFYIMAQKWLGAAKTGAFYAISPFLGVVLSFIILGEVPGKQFYVALGFMIIATFIMIIDTLGDGSVNRSYEHTHEHSHGTMVHTHTHTHFTMTPMHIHFHSH